jgi:hypothetical protein
MEQCNSVPKGAWRAPKDTQRSDRNGVCQLPGAAQLTDSVSVRFLSDFCQISNELSVGCMLGLDNPSIIGMKRVAAMFYAYRSVRGIDSSPKEHTWLALESLFGSLWSPFGSLLARFGPAGIHSTWWNDFPCFIPPGGMTSLRCSGVLWDTPEGSCGSRWGPLGRLNEVNTGFILIEPV